MARWKLLQEHYLPVIGCEWEYTENDRKTGRPKRHKFAVPQHLDPKSSTDWNAGPDDDGYIVVANKESNEFPRDYIFTGDPTPDMQPIDEDAAVISASFADKWKHPIEELPAQGGFSAALLTQFQTEVAAASAKPAEVMAEGMKEILATMAAMMKQNQELIAIMAKGATEAGRRA